VNPALNPDTTLEENPKRALIGPTGLTLLAVTLVVTAGSMVFESTFANKIFPGVVAANIPIGGLQLEAATQKLELALSKTPAPKLTVRAGARSLVWDAAALGWRADAQATALQAQGIGRRGNLFKQVQDRMNALAGKIETPLLAKVDERTVRQELSLLAKPFLVPAVNASIALEAGRFVVRPDRIGQGLNLEPSIRAYLQNPNLNELNLKVVPVAAEHTSSEFMALAERANALLRPMKLTYIAPVSSGATGSGATGSGATAGPSRTRTLTSLEVSKLFRITNGSLEADPAGIQDRLERLANAFDQPARQARYVRSQGQLVIKAEARGWKLDLKTAQSLLAEEVLRADSSEVILPVIGDDPTVASGNLPKPEGLTLISEATTTYYGSSRERMINVATATGKLDGYVVPAGGEFNFNEAVGPIELENGFAEALVISAGRTVKGVGGGVCQASTTAFRALYKAGLPVLERNQHAYRVHWYDPLIGLDAAVYQPSLNMRMQNDTAGPLLIRTETLPGRTTVRVYGQPTNRNVVISNASILSRTPHPPPAFEFDRSLPPGARKQVDWAEDGFRVRVSRTVTDANGSKSDVIASDYRAWRAVYAVGPSVRASGRSLASRTSSR
jgi:vancomycin resistance protein YoaR